MTYTPTSGAASGSYGDIDLFVAMTTTKKLPD